MISLAYRLRFLGLLLLCLLPAIAHADDVVFGVPEEQAVEFKPERHVDPMKLLPIEVNGKWGFADRQGHIIIVPRYDWADYFYGPILYDSLKNKNLYRWRARYRVGEKTGWLTFSQTRSRGQKNMKAEVLEVGNAGDNRDHHQDNFAIYERLENSQWRDQLVRPDIIGREMIVFDEALRMSGGLMAVRNGELCGYMDQRGKVTIPLQFSETRSFHEGFAAVRLPQAQNNAWAFVGRSGKFRFLDKAGEIEDLRSYHEGLVAVKARGKWGFLDKRQKIRIKPTYDEVRDFVDKLAAVRRGNQWGYINTTGKEVAWGFDGAWDFDTSSRSGLEGNTDNALSTSLGLIRRGDAYGYVDRTGQLALEIRYESALPFFRGVARVKCGNSFAYINQDGRPAWDPRRVTRFGVRGMHLADATEPIWPGLPKADNAWGEPYPFEYDVEDHLPHLQPRNHTDWLRRQGKAPGVPEDQPDLQSPPDETNTQSNTRQRHIR